MNRVREWHSAGHEIAVEALGNDEQAVVIVEWVTLLLLVLAGGCLCTRSARQLVGLLSDVSEVVGAFIALLSTVMRVLERTWLRLFYVAVSAIIAFAILRLACESYASLSSGGEHEEATAELADRARAAVANVQEQLSETASASSSSPESSSSFRLQLWNMFNGRG